MFNSRASAPACSISMAYLIQPPVETPFRLAMIGMFTACLAFRTNSR